MLLLVDCRITADVSKERNMFMVKQSKKNDTAVLQKVRNYLLALEEANLQYELHILTQSFSTVKEIYLMLLLRDSMFVVRVIGSI